MLNQSWLVFVQERKVELHDALVKMVQGGSVDGLLQVCSNVVRDLGVVTYLS